MDFSARFSDGKTSAVTEVTIRLVGDVMEVVDTAGGDRLMIWPLNAIIVHDEFREGQAVRLSAESDPECRVTVSNPTYIQVLRERLPRRSQTALRQVPKWRHIGAYGVLMVAAVVGLYFATPVLIKAAVNFLPYSWEKKLGNRYAGQFEKILNTGKTSTACRERAQAMADKIITRIKLENRLKQQFHISVWSNNMVNAFAFPGGRLIVMEGLIKAASSPQEVAGVIGHEMAHEIQRHVAQAYVRSLILDYTINLIFGTGVSADLTQTLASNAYSRDAEREADEVGARLLEKARIDTHGIRTFFEKLAKQEKGFAEKFEYFSTHPRSQDRADHVKTVSQQTIPVMPKEDWHRLRQVCEFDEAK